MSRPISTTTEISVPDIGDFKNIPIIEIHVAPGDTVAVDDPLLTIESDKATLDVPSPVAGTVADVLVKVGDQVSAGDPILLMHQDDSITTPPSLVEQQNPAPSPTGAKPDTDTSPAGEPARAQAATIAGETISNFSTQAPPPRAVTESGRQKLTVALPREDIARLEELARSWTNKTTALIRAIRTTHYLHTAAESGSKVMLKDPDGSVREILLM